MDLEAVVLEYLSPDSGSLEIKLPSGGTMSCYFHAESVWIINRWGNPYGLPVPFVEPNGAPRDSLPLELPLGSLVNIRYCHCLRFRNVFSRLYYPLTKSRGTFGCLLVMSSFKMDF